MTDLSIIILTQNHCDLLINCLDSIYQNTFLISLKVFVVDNGSTDGTIEKIESQFPEVKLIKNSHFPGFAAANNQAFNQVNSRYVMILNDDTVIHKHTLEKLVTFLDKNCDVGAVGPYLEYGDGTHQLSAFIGFPDLFSELFSRELPFRKLKFVKRILPKNVKFNKYGYYFDAPNITRQVKHLMGACIMVREEILSTVGYLDERMFLSYEDQDWCRRINNVGKKVYYYPQAKVTHFGGKSQSRTDWADHEIIKSRIYFHSKYSTKFISIYIFLLILKLTLKLAIDLVKIKFSNKHSIESKKRIFLSFQTIKDILGTYNFKKEMINDFSD